MKSITYLSLEIFDLWIGDDVRNDLVENLHSKLKNIR